MNKDKSNILKAELHVVKKEYLTPHYIRVYLTGDGVKLFENTTVGVNNKILVPPKGVEKIYFPGHDERGTQQIQHPEEVRPTIRTYTHRGMDLAKNQLWIDFVAHGDEGPASAWAIGAKEGDVLGVLMKAGKKQLHPKADSYLLVGDATAIPVLGAILEQLPPDANGLCIIEVAGMQDEQPLYTRADIRFKWLHNGGNPSNSQMAAELKGEVLPTGSRFAYVAAEFSTVKELRHYLRTDCGWKKEELYAYSYWKSGMAEDQSAEDRRREKQAAE